MTKAGGIEQLLLLDPELGNPGGHYANYAEMIRDACERIGIGFSVMGGEGSATSVFDPINAAFLPRWMGGALVNPFLGGHRMPSQLRAHATGKVSPNTLVFAATANHRHYAALGRWLENFDDASAPKLAVLLRFPEYDSRRRRWNATAHLTGRGLARLEKSARRREIRLVTDSEGLAAEYGRLTRLPVTALPIPHMVYDWPQALAGPIMRFGYFGEARREKGFDLLVDAIDILAKSDHLSTEGGGVDFKLVIQSYVRAGFEEQGCVPACKRLAAMKHANVRVLEGSLDPCRFRDEFLACDAVLVPYVLERYRERNSGVFADAVAMGMGVIATRGTWMHQQLEQGFGAGVTFQGGDAAGLGRAIIEMAIRRDEMTRKARASAAKWRELHDPVLFVTALAELFTLKQ
jgi:glycosyltransferase involved in cell wall biosynthesis